MNDQIYTGDIEVSKIDKTKLRVDKNGIKRLDVVLIPTPRSNYGSTHMIVQGLTKADRDAGMRGAILGNIKLTGANRPAPQQSQPSPAAPTAASNINDEDVPY